MIEAINKTVIEKISNKVFRDYAQMYLTIEHDFLEQISSYGIPLSESEDLRVDDPLIDTLSEEGLSLSNDRKSLHCGWLSPSCKACRKGTETITFLLSVQCPKNCFFCFNPNQVDYDHLLKNTHDVLSELRFYHKQQKPLSDIALTGGEPLIHKQETLAFFHEVQELYPDAYTRLYTSGAFLDEVLLKELQDAGLDEIRFSIKTSESEKERARLLEKIKLAKRYIPFVMVEMPVMPDEYDLMTQILVELNSIPLDGINLLELCFPFNNAEKFAERGFKIKKRPFRVLYNYWYAGGLPIAGSEDACLRLLEFSLENKLSMGVHYCSLENKFTGQIYQQNRPYRDNFPTCVMSERDHFLKSAKVFGADATAVQAHFDKQGLNNYRVDTDDDYLEFPLSYVTALQEMFGDTEVGISYYVVEGEEGDALRELRIDLTTPLRFSASDI